MKKPELDILAGQRVSASYYDEVAMNQAYDCADGCTNNCANDGYVRRVAGVCTCFCPPYLGIHLYIHCVAPLIVCCLNLFWLMTTAKNILNE